MKKKILFSILFLFGVFVVNARSVEPVYIYGVDYSSVKVYGADETVPQFKKAFMGINMLLMQESEKYDFTNIVGENCNLKLKMIFDLIQECDFSDIKTIDKDFKSVDVVEKIKNYPIKETSGNGFIVIATLLDKSTGEGTYKVVLFDVETREVLKEKEFTSKARGFGLRNFWAKNIHILTKKFQFAE